MITAIVLSILMSLGPFSMPERHQDGPKPLSNQFLVQDYGFSVAERQNNFGLIPNTFVPSTLWSAENLVPILPVPTIPEKAEIDSYKRQKEKL